MTGSVERDRIEVRRWRRRRWVAYGVMLAAFAVAFHRFLFLGNFAVVEVGRVYRSAQPKDGLEELLKRRRVASVLNLRGGSPADWWYAHEVATTRRLGVDLYDLPLSAERRPTRVELLRLVHLFERCRYPILIHCKAGSDRTGLAVAIYRMIARGTPPREAIGSFSLWRGHVPAFGPERLHEPIDEYAAALELRGLSHSPERFREWIEREYDAPDRPAAFVPLRPGPRAELATDPADTPRR
jgi:hypothetical protein